MKMNIFKKFLTGAVLLAAGLFILPTKAWASDPAPVVNVTVNTSTGVISYTASDIGTGNKLVIEKDGSEIYNADLSTLATLSSSMSEAITFLKEGSLEASKSITLSGKVTNGIDEVAGSSVTIDTPSLTVYVGKVYADGINKDKLKVGRIEGGESSYCRTIDSEEKYPSIEILASAPYYIDGTDARSVNANEYKISAGPKAFTASKVSATLTEAPASLSASPYPFKVALSPDISDYYNFGFKADSDFPSDGSFELLSLGDSYDREKKEVTFNPTGSGTGKGTIKMYASTSPSVSKDYWIMDIKNVTIDFTSPPPTPTYSVAFTEKSSAVIAGDTCTFKAKAVKTTGSTSANAENQNLTWTVTTQAGATTTGVTLSPTSTTSAEQAVTVTGVTPGTYKITVKSTEYNKEISTDFTVSNSVYISGARHMVAGAEESETYTLVGKVESDVEWSCTPATSDYFEFDATTHTLSTTDKKAHPKVVITAKDKTSGDVLAKTEVYLITLKFKLSKLEAQTTISLGSNTLYSCEDNDKEINKKNVSFEASPLGEVTSGKLVIDDDTSGTIDITVKLNYYNVPEEISYTFTDIPYYYNETMKVDGEDGEKLTFDMPDDGACGFDEIKGYVLEVYSSNSSSAKPIYTSDVIKKYDGDYISGGDSIEISLQKLSDYVNAASANLSGETHSVYFRVYPYGVSSETGKSTSNKDARSNFSGTYTAYRVSVSGDHAKTQYYYGLEDQKVTVTATMNDGYSFSKWSDGNTDNPRSVTIKDTTSSNSYKAVSTSSSSSNSTTNSNGSTPGKNGTNSNLDKVPKTGESMAIYWIVIVAVISGSIAASILYQNYAPKLKKWKGGDEGNGDNFSKK